MSLRNPVIRDAWALFGLCLILTLACSPSAPAPITKPAQSSPPTLEDALAAWDKGCEAIRSYDVFIRSEQKTLLDVRELDAKDWSPLKTPFIKKEASHQIFALGKRRIEPGVSKPGQDAVDTFAWDGKTARRYNDGELYIDPSSSSKPSGPDYEVWFRAPSSMTYADILRERPDTRLEENDGDQCVLYTPPVTGQFEFGPFGFRVWLDVSKNSLPSRIEYLLSISGQEVVYERLDISLEEVESGTWAPVKLANAKFPPIVQTDVPPRRSVEGVAVLNLDVSKFNTEIPEAAFRLETPPGARVIDRAGESHAAQIFANSSDVLGRISTAIADARLGKAHVLLMLGLPGDQASHQLALVHHGIHDDARTFPAKLAGYRAIGINANDPATVKALADLDIPVEIKGTPILLVLNGDGKLIGAQSFAPTKENGKLDRNAIEEFIAEYEPNKMDAEQLLAAALEQARRENKRVYLQETGMACAPCLAMSRFLNIHKAIIDQYFIVLKITRGRYTSGIEVMHRLREEQSIGIPWVAILDDEGHVLANSDNSEGNNIGFPFEPADIEHFLKMLSSTAQRMTPEQVQELRLALSERTKVPPKLREPATEQ